MVKELVKFLDESPTAFGAVNSIVKMLKEKGYKRLDDKKIQKGGKYFLTRNDSSIIAFNVGKRLKDTALHITASHADCPSFKLKPQPVLKDDHSCRLNVETYGGLLKRPWFDRPLKIAGRVILNGKNKLKSVFFNDNEALCIIPSASSHSLSC